MVYIHMLKNKLKETKGKKGDIRYSGELNSKFEIEISNTSPYSTDQATRSYFNGYSMTNK